MYMTHTCVYMQSEAEKSAQSIKYFTDQTKILQERKPQISSAEPHVKLQDYSGKTTQELSLSL